MVEIEEVIYNGISLSRKPFPQTVDGTYSLVLLNFGPFARQEIGNSEGLSKKQA